MSRISPGHRSIVRSTGWTVNGSSLGRLVVGSLAGIIIVLSHPALVMFALHSRHKNAHGGLLVVIRHVRQGIRLVAPMIGWKLMS